MNPQETQLQELEARVRELESIISTLYSSAGFDPLIVRAITSVVSLPSVKTTTSATRAVNEGGVATYSVM